MSTAQPVYELNTAETKSLERGRDLINRIADKACAALSEDVQLYLRCGGRLQAVHKGIATIGWKTAHKFSVERYPENNLIIVGILQEDGEIAITELKTK